MANMTENQRGQMERYDLGETKSRLFTASGRERKVWAVYSVIAMVVLVLLSIAAISILNTWRLIVLADIIILFFGIAAWLNPNRKHV